MEHSLGGMRVYSLVRSLLAAFTSLALLCACSGNGGTQAPIAGVVAPATPTPMASVPIAGTTPQSGTVVLPSGVAIAPSALTVVNSVGKATPNASGAFTIAALPGGPQFALVTDQNGNPVLAGFLSSAVPTIDSLSTAKLLVYFGAAFYTLPSPYRTQIIDAVASAPGFTSVQNAVVAALQSNPSGLATSPGVASALTTFVTNLYAKQSTSNATRLLRAGQRARPADVLVNPSTALSGITTINDFPDGVHFMNAYRRAAEAFIDRDSYVDQNGTRQPSAQQDVAPPVPIGATSGLSNVSGSLASAAAGYFSGATAYTPTSTSTTPLSNMSGAQSTRYLITVVGAGKPNSSISLRSEEMTAQQLLSVQQLVQDFIVPIIASIVIPVNSSQIDNALGYDGGNAALTDLITTLTTAAPQIYTLMNAGQVDDAFTAAMNAILTSNTLQAAFLQFLQNQVGSSLNQTAAQAFFTGGTALLNKINILSGVLVASDVAVVSANIASSNDADQFTVDVTADKVTLSPATANVLPSATQTYAANVPSQSGSGETIVWQWANTAAYGHLSDGIAGHADNFNSSSNTVTYTANPTGMGTDTITVTAFLVNGQNRVQVGNPQTATAVVQNNQLCNGNFAQGFNCWTKNTLATGYFNGYPHFTINNTGACLSDPDGTNFYQTDVPGNAESLLTQSFTVPTGKPTLYMLTWGNLQAVNVNIDVTTANGAKTVIASFTPPSIQATAFSCSGATPQIESFDFSAYAGQTITFGIDASSTGNNGTIANFTDIGFTQPSGTLARQRRP